MTETNEPKQEQPAAMHAYIEVMGHQCAVGRVSDVRIGNVTMLRVEPLAEDDEPHDADFDDDPNHVADGDVPF